MAIHILLPFKDKFDKNFPGSVSITIKNTIHFSRYKKDLVIYGDKVENPILPKNFVGIEKTKNPFKSKNKHLADQMCSLIKKNINSREIIEIHNRPNLVNGVLKKLKNVKIFLIFHNDPLMMIGSKTVKERKNLLEDCDKILCVSNFIRNLFLKGIKFNREKVVVLHNGVNRKLKSFPKKKKEVLFVGKINKDKGVHLYVEAIKQIFQEHKNWRFSVIGTPMKRTNKEYLKFFNNVKNTIKLMFDQGNLEMSLSHEDVQKRMQEAAIVVIPSIWNEPYGLVVSESMSNGAAVIASNKGGIPEIIKDNGILINNINAKKLAASILELINNPKLLKLYQKKSWQNFHHTGEKAAITIDKIREKFLI